MIDGVQVSSASKIKIVLLLCESPVTMFEVSSTETKSLAQSFSRFRKNGSVCRNTVPTDRRSFASNPPPNGSAKVEYLMRLSMKK